MLEPRGRRKVALTVAACALTLAVAAAGDREQRRSSDDLRQALTETERQFVRFATEALTAEDSQRAQRGEFVPIGVVTPSTDMKRCQETFVRELRSRRRDKTLKHAVAAMLGEAARLAMTDVMKALLDIGVDPNAPYRGSTPLRWAIQSGSVEGVRLLTAAGVDAAQVAEDALSHTRTPLIVFAADVPASAWTAPEIIRLLLDRGAPIDMTVQDGAWSGETALFKAARRGNAPLTAFLLDKGADPNLRLKDTGHTPLMSGAGYPDVARLLLAHGADLHATDNYGRSATIFAALDGCPEAVAFLRERGGRMDVPDKHGKTANAYLAEFSKDAVPMGICAPKR